MYNIQVMLDMLPELKLQSLSKTRYTQVQQAIKTLVKDIRKQKEFITDKVYEKHVRHIPKLFEVHASELEQIDISTISSYFGFED